MIQMPNEEILSSLKNFCFTIIRLNTIRRRGGCMLRYTIIFTKITLSSMKVNLEILVDFVKKIPLEFLYVGHDVKNFQMAVTSKMIKGHIRRKTSNYRKSL